MVHLDCGSKEPVGFASKMSGQDKLENLDRKFLIAMKAKSTLVPSDANYFIFSLFFSCLIILSSVTPLGALLCHTVPLSVLAYCQSMSCAPPLVKL